LRKQGDEFVVVVVNFTPVPRYDYRIGVPKAGRYHECLNSDSQYYAGGNLGNGNDLYAQAVPWMDRKFSVTLTLPPLAGIVLRWEGD